MGASDRGRNSYYSYRPTSPSMELSGVLLTSTPHHWAFPCSDSQTEPKPIRRTTVLPSTTFQCSACLLYTCMRLPRAEQQLAIAMEKGKVACVKYWWNAHHDPRPTQYEYLVRRSCILLTRDQGCIHPAARFANSCSEFMSVHICCAVLQLRVVGLVPSKKNAGSQGPGITL
jgi:hypothetical protein